jgi:dipeptidyl aminopeptidase/acylaminoacyl peptidase
LETPDWDIEAGVTDTRSISPGFDLSGDDSLLAFTVNVDGYSQLTVKETGTWRNLYFPGVPAGVITGLNWSPDSTVLSFTAMGSRNTPDIYLADLSSLSIKKLTKSSTAGIPPGIFVDPELIRIPAHDGRVIPGFYYRPNKREPHTGYACVIYVHGGPESQFRPDFQPPIQYLVHRGYAVLATNVRGSTGYGREYAHLDDVRLRMDSVRDLKSAVEWLSKNKRADAARIAVMGGSYGGFMVLSAVTTYPDLWAAGIDFFGIGNFETFLENTGPWRRKLREIEYGNMEDDGEFLREISPIHHVENITCPMLVAQGLNDPRVPPVESEQIVESLNKRKIPTKYITFPDEGHGFTKLGNRIAVYTAVADFLDEHVGA